MQKVVRKKTSNATPAGLQRLLTSFWC